MRFTHTLVAFAALTAAAASQAMTVDVYALNNSSTGGIGLNTINLNVGQTFSVTVDLGDLWNAGDLPRWSNADGLVRKLFATGSDDSGKDAGTEIGINWGTHSADGLSAPYGSLVGKIGSSNYFFVGTSYAGTAAAAGTLKLFYWDSYAGDNTDYITASVSAVPEPGSVALLLAGLGALGFASRRRGRCTTSRG